ncbi:MAG: LysM peptidoglycan-binding domain-containing protein, partial [Planctomycetales bacterium]|nr:LysM peptidoglycan-binding domain-containing protein [Planctomycetales bacterium]
TVKSIKNAFVFLVMLGVVYGVWQMLNKKPIAPPAGMLDGVVWNPPKLDFSSGQAPTALAPPQVSGQPPLSPPAVALPGATALGVSDQAGGSPYARSVSSTAVQPAPVIDAGAYAAAAANQSAGDPRYSSASPASSSVYSSAEPIQPPAVQPSAEQPAATASAYDRGAAALGNTAFLSAWNGAQDQLKNGELAEALFTLSLWYDSADVPADMQSQLVDTLDQLAGAVVYSPSYHSEPPYEVRPGERLEDIARQYQVPWQYLANVNGIQDPAQLTPGTRLKVVRGPFNAVVNIERRELTLLVGRRYAGRFAATFGNDPAPLPGEYIVREKDIERTFYDRDGRRF